ncbi:non-specific lipid-transfer protein-like protein At2g13820 [Vigna radiata var. radiata]|uniref:Non-specific lipid-transfer protein-like protein At2g13820 n=1 Tax=Vigna radiata var. radiata TaxID=3916 RepID=A0A1S3V412_VIGRR|nr:non-specific lipid-transfer protein-like protein At2g13820 [Vigna radiata var. radiata]
MAFRGFMLCVVTVMVATICTKNATAQSGCSSTLTSLSPCLNYVMGSSSTPSTPCCSQLSTIVQSSPQCLCSLLSGGSTFGITINQTLALSLPAACKVQTPPVSQCQAGNGPTPPSTAPVASPSDSSAESPQESISPSASDFPSGAGSKTVPSTDGGSSDGNAVEVPSHLVFYLIAIVSFVLTFIKF